jgi:NADH:ubiquinone oxidoreductase subunit
MWTREGRGEFIGTQKEDGTDAEQRADARTVYEGIIEGSRIPRDGAAWGRIHHRVRRLFNPSIHFLVGFVAQPDQGKRKL